MADSTFRIIDQQTNLPKDVGLKDLGADVYAKKVHVTGSDVTGATEATTAALLVEVKVLNGAYAMRTDDVGGGVIYQGWALPATATSAAAWRIKRITETGSPSDFTIEWAASANTFTNIWDNRAGLTYG